MLNTKVDKMDKVILIGHPVYLVHSLLHRLEKHGVEVVIIPQPNPEPKTPELAEIMEVMEINSYSIDESIDCLVEEDNRPYYRRFNRKKYG